MSKTLNSQKTTPAPTASINAAHTSTAPVIKHQVEFDEVDLLINAPRRYFETRQDECAYYATKEQQEAFSVAPDFNTMDTVHAPDARGVQCPSSKANPVAAPVVANAQPSPVPTAIPQSPIVTLAWCNAWLQLTYAHEMTELAKLGAYVQARVVRAPGERISPSSSVLLSVKDGLCDGEVGSDGELTFTFWDLDHAKVALGALTMPQFQAMAHRFWQALPHIKAVYQARAAYLDATGASPDQALPDVEGQHKGHPR